MDNELADALRAYTAAGIKLFDVAQKQYRAAHPEDHAAFTAYVEHGKAELYLTQRLPNDVELGFVISGKPNAIFASAPPKAKDVN